MGEALASIPSSNLQAAPPSSISPLTHLMLLCLQSGWEKPWVEQIIDRIMKGMLRTTEERTQGVVSDRDVGDVGRGRVRAGHHEGHAAENGGVLTGGYEPGIRGGTT